MTQHTSAPWTVHRGGYNIEANGEVIFFNGFAVENDQELEANAQLAATSPELLDCLEMVTTQLDAIVQGFEYPRELLIAKIEKARSVVRKAVGDVEQTDTPKTRVMLKQGDSLGLLTLGKAYLTYGKQVVTITAGSADGPNGGFFVGDNGIWYDIYGLTNSGRELTIDLTAGESHVFMDN